MSSSLSRERAEQRRWKLRPQWAQVKTFDQMVEREFLSPEQQDTLESVALRRIIAFAAAEVPYYRRLFERLGIAAEDLRHRADLGRLPVLTRSDVQAHGAALRARRLPKGHRIAGMTKTSGSTGQPVEVLQTDRALRLFPILKQRQLRWARFDPGGRIGMIRPPQDLPMSGKNKRLAEGETCALESWSKQVGPYFETGPLFGFSNRNSVDSQLAWLEEHRIDYLLGQSAELEHLALAAQGHGKPVRLGGLLAISQQMMPEMRQRIEKAFGATVHENYGFNEIGIVATRCPEGGRYHVNSEHCLVEIVDSEGRPCPPGEAGHLLATGLTNAAMPLLRYDSGDLAEAVEGPCPCGRTLPAFGAIQGRYRRIANLPPDTFKYWAAIRRALGDMPEALARPLRQYQVHQYRNGHYELRLVTAADLDDAFTERVQAEWHTTGAPTPPPLSIRVVEEIPTPPGGKFQDFTSDFAPPPAVEGPAD